MTVLQLTVASSVQQLLCQSDPAHVSSNVNHLLLDRVAVLVGLHLCADAHLMVEVDPHKHPKRGSTPAKPVGGLARVSWTAYGVSKGRRRGPARRESTMKIPTVRAGAHIEGVHWVAEYAEDVHEIRVFREGQEVDVHNAPSTLFGDEENAGSKSTADHRAVEAAVLAYLRRFVMEHDAEE
jgi:hypothetical protein